MFTDFQRAENDVFGHILSDVRLGLLLVRRDAFQLGPKLIERMRKRASRVQRRLTKFVATHSQHLGQNRRPDEQCQVETGANLSTIAQMIKVVVNLVLTPYFWCELISEIMSLVIAMVKCIEDNDLGLRGYEIAADLVSHECLSP